MLVAALVAVLLLFVYIYLRCTDTTVIERQTFVNLAWDEWRHGRPVPAYAFPHQVKSYLKKRGC